MDQTDEKSKWDGLIPQEEAGKLVSRERVEEIMKLIREAQNLTDSKKREMIKVVEELLKLHLDLEKHMKHLSGIETQQVGSMVCTNVTVKPSVGKGPYSFGTRFGISNSVTMTTVSGPQSLQCEDSREVKKVNNEKVKVHVSKQPSAAELKLERKVEELRSQVKELVTKNAFLENQIVLNPDYKQLFNNLKLEEANKKANEEWINNFVKGMGTGAPWPKKKIVGGRVVVLRDEEASGDHKLKIKEFEVVKPEGSDMDLEKKVEEDGVWEPTCVKGQD